MDRGGNGYNSNVEEQLVFYGNMLGEIKKAERGEETKEGFGNAVA